VALLGLGIFFFVAKSFTYVLAGPAGPPNGVSRFWHVGTLNHARFSCFSCSFLGFLCFRQRPDKPSKAANFETK